MNDNQPNKNVPNEPKPATAAPKQITINRKTLWIILGGIAAVIIAAIIIVVVMVKPGAQQTNTQPTEPGPSPEQTQMPQQSTFTQQYGQGCKERDVAFTSPPMKMEELSYIRPLGAMSDGHVTPTDHVYIGGPNQNAADNTYSVLMPADGTITEVSAMPAQYIGDRAGQQVAAEDHRIVISHSCRYFSIYIHVHKLSDKLAGAVGTLQPNQSKQANLDLKAGDVVGYIGGSTFDWTPIDTTKTLAGFITPSLYQSESWKVHTVSPFDLYTGSLKSQLEAKSLRSAAPVGGKIDYDQPGKLIGNWFREGTGGYSRNSQGGGRYWDGHLSVVPDYINPDYTIVSTGNWQGSAKQFVVSGSVDPAVITEQSGLVTYELKKLNYVTSTNGHWSSGFVSGLRPDTTSSVEGTVAFQVMPGEKLKAETFPGKTAAQVTAFTSAAQIYER